MFRKLLDDAQAGDNVGVLLRGIEKNQVQRGQVYAAPGTIKPHKKFKGQYIILPRKEGRQAHAVLQRVQAAVLLQDDGRDGSCEAAGGDGDGDAWRQRADGHRADSADSDRE